MSDYIQIRIIEREEPPDLPPVVIISSPQNMAVYYVNEMIHFESGSFDPEGSNLSFNWYVDDIKVSNVSNFSMDLSSGTHEIKLVVADDLLSNLTSVIIVVNDRSPILHFEVNGTEIDGNEITVLVNDTVVFNASGSFDPDGTAVTFVWQVDGTVVGTRSYVNLKFEAGIHMVSLNLSDSTGSLVTNIFRVICLERQIDNDDDEPVDDDAGPNNTILDYLLIRLGIILLLVLVAGAIFIIYRKSRFSYPEE
jgi:hypothetical protein